MSNRDTREQGNQSTYHPMAGDTDPIGGDTDPIDKDKLELTKDLIEKNRAWARTKARPKKYTGS